MAPYQLGYWAIRGLAAPARMMLAYSKADYEDKTYKDASSWFSDDKPELAKKNPLVNLPYLVDGDVVITHSNSIFAYLGDKLALTPEGEAERYMDNQVLMEVMDIRNDLVSSVYPFGKKCRTQEEFDERRVAILEKELLKHYAKLEALLNKQDGPFFCGETPGPCDFHLFEMMDQHELLADSIEKDSPLVGKFPALEKHYAAFRKLSELKAYFASDAYKLPCNNPMGKAYFT